MGNEDYVYEIIYPANCPTFPFIETTQWGSLGYSAKLNILSRETNLRKEWNPQKNGFKLKVSGKEIPADLQDRLLDFGVEYRRLEDSVA